MPDPHHPQAGSPDVLAAYRPTPGQLALLRRLTFERGATTPWPKTRAQAARAIRRLAADRPTAIGGAR